MSRSMPGRHGAGSWYLRGQACLATVFVLGIALAGSQAESAKNPAPPATPAPSAAGARTEILSYDNWTVTCRDGRDGREKRSCVGELVILQDLGNGARRPVFSWVLGLNKDSQLVSALRFPPGVVIAPGLRLKLSDKVTLTVPITSCEPAVCEAMETLDDAFIREASAATQIEANLQATDGRIVTFTVYPKGFSQTVTALLK